MRVNGCRRNPITIHVVCSQNFACKQVGEPHLISSGSGKMKCHAANGEYQVRRFGIQINLPAAPWTGNGSGGSILTKPQPAIIQQRLAPKLWRQHRINPVSDLPDGYALLCEPQILFIFKVFRQKIGQKLLCQADVISP